MSLVSSFTGRIGTANSRFGNIVFAALDGFPSGFDFRAHQLTSRRVRILFGFPVTDTALDLAHYSFAAVVPPTTYVPAAESVEFYDERRRAVVITFAERLTTGMDYSVGVDGVVYETGETILNGSRNFTANVTDPPRAVGAFLSKRGAVDIVFDRPVGPYSALASFSIRDAAGGPSFAMTQLTWSGEGVPDTTLRATFPPTTPTADAFVIDFSGVSDVSMNPSSGTVPLTLALRSPAPYSYADLTQLQLIDAYVTDVSSDYLRTATVRVFFSCPVLDADVVGNWTLTMDGPHPETDTVDAVAAPDATDLASLLTLSNDLKAKLNAHLVIDQVHVVPDPGNAVTSPDAVDLASAATLINEMQSRLLSHFSNRRSHLYPDTVHPFLPLTVGPADLSLAISVANLLLKANYNAHLAAAYPLSFSSVYSPPIGQIQAYSREAVADRAFDVDSPHTYYADLHVFMDVDAPAVNVLASLTSEDGGSVTSTLDYTGSISARAASAPASVRSHLVRLDEAVEVRFDREIRLSSGSPISVLGPDGSGIPAETGVSATLRSALWAYNNALEAYRYHIIPGAAGHQDPDFSNLVSPSDYAVLPLSSAIASVNDFRQKLTSHLSSAIFHFHPDPDTVRAPEATDSESLIALIADIRRVVSGHNVRVGPHSTPGYRMASASLFDVLRSGVRRMRDGLAHSMSGILSDGYVYNGLPRSPPPSEAEERLHRTVLSLQFTGLAVRPSLASAVPRTAIVLEEDFSLGLGSDAVEVFFSKPMHRVPLDSSNLPVTGGSIQQKETGWTSPVTAEAVVLRMETIPYSVTAVGLTDEAGNPVF